MVEWRAVADWPNYEVSSDGQVASLKGRWTTERRILKKVDCFGYERVCLADKSYHSNIVVHRMVATAFIPNPKNLRQVNHKNGNKSDNRVENLEWLSQSENMKHAYDIGLQAPIRGEDNILSKLKESQVREIRMLSGQITHKEIAKKFGISRSLVGFIIQKKRWSHID